MGHASIVTTMRYIHATDQGKPGAITVLSDHRQQRQKRRHKFVTNENRQAQVIHREPAASSLREIMMSRGGLETPTR